MTRRRDRQTRWDQERQTETKNRRPVPQKKQQVQISPRTTNQKIYLKQLQSERNNIIFAIGAAGVGKTYLPCLLAVKMLKEGLIEKVVVTRPAVSVDEEHGFLPGPQPLDAKILTPSGWTTMGELSVGDSVIGRDGKPTKVLGIYPKGTKQVYRITTTDGTSTEACADHLWHTRTLEDRKRGRLGSVKTTAEINETLLNSKGKVNHILPRNEAVEFITQELPIPPYLLGAILGDGSIGNTVGVCNTDGELIARVASEVAYMGGSLSTPVTGIVYNITGNLLFNKPAKPVILKNKETGKVISEFPSIGLAAAALTTHKSTIQTRCKDNITIDGISYEYGETPVRWTNPIKNQLHLLGLSGKKCHDKFIPDVYKYSSIDQRLDLLRGLMDTDGSIKRTGEASYATTSLKLAEDVIEIVRSLGGRATLCSRNRVGDKNQVIDGRTIHTRHVSYEFTISLPEHHNPFYISRKAERWSQKYIHSPIISSIEPVGEKEVQCILVDSDEHLYITDDFIVTHNTLEQKMAPWVRPIFDVFSQYYYAREIESMIKEGVIEIAPLSFMRGRSFQSAFIIADEMQNATVSQVKMLLTRIGEGSKMVVTGDLNQHDRGYENNGLADFIDRLTSSGSKRMAVTVFGTEDIQRHPVVAEVLHLYGED